MAKNPIVDKIRAVYAKAQTRLKAVRKKRIKIVEGAIQKRDAKKMDELRKKLGL